MGRLTGGALDRRRMLQGAAGLGGLGLLSGCATAAAPVTGPVVSAAPAAAPKIILPPIHAATNRVIDITVCTRPFRAAGPRLDVETAGRKTVVHNYGHGGSGWSLSWGSGALAVRKAMASSPRSVAVIGCGALGLTAAILAQEAGAQVTIYARDLLPDARSSRATGIWSPDSRIALADAAGPAFAALWEEMARTSWKSFRRFMGLPGAPVAWADRYTVADSPAPPPVEGALAFGEYRARVRDVVPGGELLPAGATNFPAEMRVRRQPTLVFNLASYGHTLMSRFLAAGGAVRRMEFHSPADLAALKEPVVIHCTGYGARALWRDESVVPVRGQIAWLVPQPEVAYALAYRDVNVVARSDGIGVQDTAGGDMRGYGDAGEAVDRAESEAAIGVIAGLYARMAG